MSDSSAYILALMRIPGVGRVAAGRLADSFPDPEALLTCPREQVLLRLKGIPGAAQITRNLSDALADRLPQAQSEVEALRDKHVHVANMLDDDWPSGLADLPRGHRPVALYVYGQRETFSKPWVAFVASPPLSDASFELAQKAIRTVADADAVPATGASSGFDVVAHKLCNDADPPQPAAMMVPCGLTKLASELRPVATTTVRSGGVLVSAFPMNHGPFAHDVEESGFVLAALSSAVVTVHRRNPVTPSIQWAIAAGRPVFSIGGADDDSRLHRLASDTDLEWLIVAATSKKSAS